MRQRIDFHPRQRRTATVLAFAAITAAGYNHSLADTHTWTYTGSNYWDIASCWSAGQMPAVGDRAYVVSSTNITVTRDSITPSYAAPGLVELRLDGSGAVVTLSQSANAMYAGNEYIGYYGTAQYLQTGGSNTIGTLLCLAYLSNSVGTYTLSGAGSSVSAPTLILADDSNTFATFNQNGGTVQATTRLDLGNLYTTAQGVYRLTGGTLTAGLARIGTQGVGTFSQTGGVGTITGDMQVGVSVGSSGALDISGGSMNVSGTTYIGGASTGAGGAGTITLIAPATFDSHGGIVVYGNGQLTQNSGTLRSRGDLIINGGEYDSISGSCYIDAGHRLSVIGGGYVSISNLWSTLNNTGVSVTNGDFVTGGVIDVGNGGIGTLTVDGISASVLSGSGESFWGSGSGGAATVTFSNNAFGSFAAASPGRSGGSGNVNINSGADLTVGYFTVGWSGGSGTVNLSDAGSSFHTNSYMTIGSNGTALFNQTGGSASVGGRLFMGDGSTGYGKLTINGGSFSVGSLTYVGGSPSGAGGQATISVSGTGSFSAGGGIYVWPGGRVSQSGGTLASGGDVSIDGGRYDLASGTLVLSPGHSINVTGGGTVAITGNYSTPNNSGISVTNGQFSAASFCLGSGSGTSGTLSISGGQATILSGDTYIGGTSAGVGGTATLSVSGTGVYNTAWITAYSGGRLTQSGGTVTAVGFTLNGGRYDLSGGAFTSTDGEFIGGSGLFNQTGGTHSSGFTEHPEGLRIGYYVGDTGTYVLGNGTLNVFGYAYVGSSGSGIFNQSGGTLTVATNGGAFPSCQLHVGAGAGGTGTYLLSGGILNVTGGSELVGNYGSGTFLQSGGTHSINDTLVVGFYSAGAGYFALSGSGALKVSDDEYVGYSGSGSFIQSAGDHAIGNSLFLGCDGAGVGYYELSGGTLESHELADIGHEGTGTFIQSGGRHITNVLQAGTGTSSEGTYYLKGTGSLTAVWGEFIGVRGNGSFSQSGGTDTIVESLYLGYYSSGTGTYLLQGGTLNVGRYGQDGAYIGGSSIAAGGTGVLNVSGGSMTVTGTMKVWNATGTAVNFSGGALSVGTLETSGNPSRFNWTGGTLSLTASDLYVSSSGPLGALVSINAGKSLSVSGAERVGYYGGTGTISQSGGYNTAGELDVGGSEAASVGTYLLSGGTLNINSREFVGYECVSIFKQSGGTHTIGATAGTGDLFVGHRPGGNGTFLLSGGTLKVGRDEYISAYAGSYGTFIQSGGAHTIASATEPGNLYIGVHWVTGGGDGTYVLNNPEARLTVNGGAYLGGGSTEAGGSGVLNLAAGTMVTGEMKLWDTPGTALNFSGGVLSVSALDTDGNPTRFNWTGGTLNITGSYLNVRTLHITNGMALNVSWFEIVDDGTAIQSGGINNGKLSVGYNSVGTYLLSGGTLNGGDEDIGHQAYFGGVHGTFIQSGGVNNAGYLSLGTRPTSSGAYFLQDGTLNVSGSEFIAKQGVGQFVQTGGTHTIGAPTSPQTLWISSAADYYFAPGTYLLDGPAARLTVYGDVQVGGVHATPGTVTIGNGTLNVTGSTSLWNNSRINYNGGTFSTGGLELYGGADVILSAGRNKTLRASSVSIDTTNGSKLDLADNRMIVDYSGASPITFIRQLLQSGSAGGWSGNGITSSSAAADPSKALGYGENVTLNLHTFGGFEVDPTSILMRYTYYGDSNLDGMVDLRDLYALASHWKAAGMDWTSGDFNYDGVVNKSDLTLLGMNWQAGVGSPLSTPLSAALSSLGLPLINVPEPGALVALGALTWSLKRPRRRR